MCTHRDCYNAMSRIAANPLHTPHSIAPNTHHTLTHHTPHTPNPPGAGNQLPVVALDILHVLVAEDKVALVKMNPVNDYAGPMLKQVCVFVCEGFFVREHKESVWGRVSVGGG